MARVAHVHGTKGAFVGGDWVDMEDCAEKFNIQGGSNERCTKQCSSCPRSRTRHASAKADGSYDVVVIGAGCIGSAVARELSRTTASVLLLEAADDVTQGATKGNSGIVHAGFDDTPGSVRARFCWKGNQMFPQLDHELHFGYERNGSLVIATSEDERGVLKELMAKGDKNGVQNLRIVEKEELFKMEPELNPNAVAALHAPDAGSLIPYEYAIALAENAADNGVEVRIRRSVETIAKTDEGFELSVAHWEPASYVAQAPAVGMAVAAALAAMPIGLLAALCFFVPGVLNLVAVPLEVAFAVTLGLGPLIFLALRRPQKRSAATQGKGAGKNVASWVESMKVGGSGSADAVGGTCVDTEVVRTRYVVNCAGVASDKVARMIGDESFTIKPRLGEYVLLHKNQGSKVKCTIFPTPHPVKGKGVLVQKTLWGNLILGPTARDTFDESTMKETTHDINTFIIGKCRELVPSFDASETIHAFCGVRAKSSRGDWIIEPSKADDRGRFVHAAGIDSPGLAGSPAIAVEVVELLKKGGLELQADPNFNPKRAPIIVPKDGRNLKYSKSAADAKGVDPKKNVVCKCEKTTEAEVVEALRRSLPIDSTQAIRKRARAGMGHCQGDPENYNCECRIAAIIAKEASLPEAAVGRRPWPATSTLPQRWLTGEQKKSLANLGR